MEAVAKLNNVPTAPRKTRLVVDTIRGLDVSKALDVLKFTRKEGALRIEKLLLSAIDNWKQKHDKDPDDSDLYVKEIYVNGGRTLKRFRPAPMGRAQRIRKRSHHVTLVVGSRTLTAAEPVVELSEESEEN